MMPYFLVVLFGPIGVIVALVRRNPRRYLDGPTEDAPLRLLRWAVDLLAPARAEWGQAMLGELGAVRGGVRRMRFALGCAGAALVLPPWGRAAVGVWSMAAVVAACLSLYGGLAVHYGLGVGARFWIDIAVIVVSLVGFMLGGSALLRRPGVGPLGLIGGTFAAIFATVLPGLSAADQLNPDLSPWHSWVTVIVVPGLIGVIGTLWNRDPVIGRRVARLAALSFGLVQLLLATIVVAVVGGGGPPETDGGPTLSDMINERLGNNMFQLALTTLMFAVVGWGGAALAGLLLRRKATLATHSTPQPEA
jgi:hypothetical protein